LKIEISHLSVIPVERRDILDQLFAVTITANHEFHLTPFASLRVRVKLSVGRLACADEQLCF
jgi:hypothetical protein